MLNGLALCAGVGGIELGLKLAEPAYRTICYVERELYCVEILIRRIKEGLLDDAPVWDDIFTFDPARWRGKVDIITTGFPCPPVSIAGRRKGKADPRWLWPRVAEIVREVGPEWVFLENVRGLLSIHSGGEFSEILGDLAGCGFDAAWGVFRASDLGATHRRERVFILGHAGGERLYGDDRRRAEKKSAAGCEGVGNTDGPRLQGRERRTGKLGGERRELPPWPPGPDERDAWAAILSERPELAPAAPEPALCRVAHGVSNWVDRIRAAGNAVVPVVAAKAFITLKGRLVGRGDINGR